MVAAVPPLLAWASLGTGFVIALAAVLRMAGSVPEGDHVTGAIRLPGPVTAAILALFGLALVVFLGDLVRRALAKRDREDDGAPAEEPTPVPSWLRRVTLVLSLVNVAVLAYLWRRAVLEGGLFVGAGGLASGLLLPDTEVLIAPALFNWVFGSLAVMAGLGALGLALWSALGDRLVPDGRDADSAMPAAPLRTAVEESLDDLRAEGDPRRAIVRCYARFERVAADSGLERRPWLTPTEFMREVLARLSLPRAAVPTLTGLFELARFSHHPLGPSERDRAVDALHEIRRATATSEGDAGG
ncbi:MAG TPA: DUF4129 domain-containing protein [Candidatus Dormibacteraeota bacterium]|nr:DUF4129 domain-containing protein [Candidatus Dormibacteraeota bacterium]